MLYPVILSTVILQTAPAVLQVDFNDWNPMGAKFVLTITAVDGKSVKIQQGVSDAAKAGNIIRGMTEYGKSNSCRFLIGDDNTFTVLGIGDSPVKEVKWESKEWTPTIRPVFPQPKVTAELKK